MSVLKIVRVRIFLIALLASLSSAAQETTNPYPDLIMHGDSYSNACKLDETKKLYNATLKSAPASAEAAWGAINTILCSPSTKSTRSYVFGLMKKTVRRNISASGEADTVQEISRSDEIVEESMAQGQAWNASLRAGPQKLYLQYFENEACVSEVVLSFADRKWMISEIGKACD